MVGLVVVDGGNNFVGVIEPVERDIGDRLLYLRDRAVEGIVIDANLGSGRPEGFLLAISPSDFVSDLVSQAESCCCALKDAAARITAANVRVRYLVMLYSMILAGIGRHFDVQQVTYVIAWKALIP